MPPTNDVALVFPHSHLTAVVGRPDNASLTLLRKQIFTNARAVHSTAGGGNDGHLGLVMPAADYLARVGVAFPVPAHPGDAAIHAAGATQAQITQTNREFDHDVLVHRTYFTTEAKLREQLLAAVDKTYLATLEDEILGFSDVTTLQMLTHLVDTYGTITADDIEQNRNRLSHPWNPEEPVERVWERIHTVQRFAIRAQEPIPDSAIVRLTVRMFETSGLFVRACDDWERKLAADKTVANMRTHFEDENRIRLRTLTAQRAGYHSANSTTTITDAMEALTIPTEATANIAAAGIPVPAPRGVHSNNIALFYCWTHGLGFNRAHTSATCARKGDGHIDNATVDNMMGGNSRIMKPRNRRNDAE